MTDAETAGYSDNASTPDAYATAAWPNNCLVFRFKATTDEGRALARNVAPSLTNIHCPTASNRGDHEMQGRDTVNSHATSFKAKVHWLSEQDFDDIPLIALTMSGTEPSVGQDPDAYGAIFWPNGHLDIRFIPVSAKGRSVSHTVAQTLTNVHCDDMRQRDSHERNTRSAVESVAQTLEATIEWLTRGGLDYKVRRMMGDDDVD